MWLNGSIILQENRKTSQLYFSTIHLLIVLSYIPSLVTLNFNTKIYISIFFYFSLQMYVSSIYW